jgi:TolB-like protein/cytochrome c-type biogenesis protein CcmH/NrfG
VIESTGAVFLSYASEDAAAAERIAASLQAGGIEVWFDQSALRGGDVWDHTIRKQIKTCVLFIPVISRHTHERDEGYFRLEWKLAVDRSHLMTTNRAFLLPVVVDDTREDDENVPDRFKDIHWTRLPGGETPPAFVERVRRLVLPEPPLRSAQAAYTASPMPITTPPMSERLSATWRSKVRVLALAAVVILAALAYLTVDKFRVRKQPPPTPPALPISAGPAAFAPPPHSIAVLPFVNMSGDKEQEYFSDGLTEEILNSLARINDLQVSARTSSFSFKGKDVKISTIARELNVGSILEGSVRRSGRTVRVTAQLNNAVTGFHLWSQTYDRDLSDVLKLQTEIADAVASALKVTLLGDVAAKIEAGGTRNPAALDAYLRGMKAYSLAHNANDYQAAITAYTEAIRLDPNYALAFAGRAAAIERFVIVTGGPDYRERLKTMEVDARQALALAPDLAEGHLALARFLQWYSLDFARANEEYERALVVAPGNALVLQQYGTYAVFVGRTAAGIAAARRAVVLDPLNKDNYSSLGFALYLGRQYDEAISALNENLALDPDDSEAYGLRGLSYYALGNLENARASCETRANKTEHEWAIRPCLAAVYAKLGRRSDAESTLAKFKAAGGDAGAYQYAQIYAQWGNTAQALDWLQTAQRLRDGGLALLKTDPLLDPLRKEPRFQAIERELKFPD